MSIRDAYVTAIPLLEDVVFTALSVVVAAALVVGIVAVPEPRIAFAAKKQPGDNPQFEVLYGVMKDESGAPVAGATIQVTSPSQTVVTVTTAADGTYRVRFKDVGGPYTVIVTTVIGGQTVTGTYVVDMQPGNTYRIDPTVEAGGSFTWWVALPIY